MTEHVIDLRSDTVTLPTEGMRRAMAEAQVGDDVFGEDPSVNRLEAQTAELLGKEAAIFVPSGTMANQIAVRLHTRPGDELLCEAHAHVHAYEAGAPAALSGVTCRAVPASRGILDPADLEGQLRPPNVHWTPTRLVCLENTANRGGGSIYPIDHVERICSWAREHRLATHLDGARLLNAAVALGVPASRWSRHFDTVSICFSKGLGAPVGSALAGSAEQIDEARRIRKMFGGGMRQAGVLAAACSYALTHHVDRLAQDHENAQILARALEAAGGFQIEASQVETNILWIPTNPALGPAEGIQAWFLQHGVHILASGPHLVRMVLHLGVSREDAQSVANLIPALVRERIRKRA